MSVVLVCGGRGYRDFQVLAHELDDMKPSKIVHGGASGADELADQYAYWRHIPVSVYRADWDQHGRAAGPIRNQEMLDKEKPDKALALPGGRGTADMVRRLKKAGIPVREIAPENIING